MPIRQALRWFYPIDWKELSAFVRFRRAKGRCECCGRPHGTTVQHLGDGRWWDEDLRHWRDGAGKIVQGFLSPQKMVIAPRQTRVILATAPGSRPYGLSADGKSIFPPWRTNSTQI